MSATQTSAPMTGTKPSVLSELLPFRRIMVAIDGSETGTWAAKAAAELSRRWNCDLALVHVVSPPVTVDPMCAELGFEAEAAALDCGRKFIDDFAVEPKPGRQLDRFLREGDVVQQVIGAATSWDADLLVIGTHSRHGLRRILLGSTAAGIVRHAPCAILCVNRLVDRIGQHVITAVDYDEQWATALKWAEAIVQPDGGVIEITHAVPDAEPIREVYGLDNAQTVMQARRDAFNFMEAMSPAVPPSVDVARNLQHGPAAKAILCAASSAKADLIIVGTTARHGLSRMMLGSTTDSVLRKAECPVLCVKACKKSPYKLET